MATQGPDQDRVKKLLTEAVTLLCRSSLSFTEQVSVEGLLGITLDKKDIFLVSIHETIKQGLESALAAADEDSEKESLKGSGKSRHRKRRRKRSRASSSSDTDDEERVSKQQKENDARLDTDNIETHTSHLEQVKQEFLANNDSVSNNDNGVFETQRTIIKQETHEEEEDEECIMLMEDGTNSNSNLNSSWQQHQNDFQPQLNQDMPFNQSLPTSFSSPNSSVDNSSFAVDRRLPSSVFTVWKVCKICGCKTSSLKRHVQIVHLMQKNFSCVCGHSTSTFWNLKSHQKTCRKAQQHTGNKHMN